MVQVPSNTIAALASAMGFKSVSEFLADEKSARYSVSYSVYLLYKYKSTNTDT
jgi:hypothetical protein